MSTSQWYKWDIYFCLWGGPEAADRDRAAHVLGLEEHGALGKSPDRWLEPNLAWEVEADQGAKKRPWGLWAMVTWEESYTSFSSWVRTSRSGAPSASRSGTWSKGLRMEAFPPKLLGWFHSVSPKTKHTSLAQGPLPT